jgi:hypothetical protein
MNAAVSPVFGICICEKTEVPQNLIDFILHIVILDAIMISNQNCRQLFSILKDGKFLFSLVFQPENPI